MISFSNIATAVVAVASTLVGHVNGQSCPPSGSRDTTSGGFEYTYPFPIQYAQIETQGQKLCQAYMDVSPGDYEHTSASDFNGETIVLLHGKNFCGATWEESINVLVSEGYRVIVPDQIGFCKSDKPENYAWSLHQLALNTKTILEKAIPSLAEDGDAVAEDDSSNHDDDDDDDDDDGDDCSASSSTITVMGHSLGGMLAARFTTMYPSIVSRLVMVNPVGLEDWKAKGVPYRPIEESYEQEASSNYTNIRGYEQRTYYLGDWRPEYDTWVYMLLELYNGSLGDLYAWIQAKIVDMVYTQPVIYEFPLIGKTGTTKTLLVVGEQDTTAIGAIWSPPEVREKLGNYEVLGKEAVELIGDNATLLNYPELGHSPHISNPDMFHEDLLEWLGDA